MKNLIDLLKEKLVIFDGAMGTSIQKKGTDSLDLLSRECNEYINVSNPTFIMEIHENFLKAGADIIETNTFGALPYLLKEFDLEAQAESINRKGVKLALEIANAYNHSDKPRYVSGSMGPGTKLPSLMQISFDELYYNYYLQAECFITESVHLIQIETGQDPLQMKAALKAVLDVKKKYNADTPIFLQATLQENGQMLVGMDLLTFINTFKDMPIHGLGINCGTGPHKIQHLVKILSNYCPLNIVVLPNAGLPILKDGVLAYDLTPNDFAKYCLDLVTNYRVNAICGCCGTTYDFIQALYNSTNGVSPLNKSTDGVPPLNNFDGETPSVHIDGETPSVHLTSLFTSQEIKTLPAPLIIGERANVNGSKKFKSLLTSNDWENMVETCVKQIEEGAHVIDVCLIHLERNESEDIATFIPLLNKTVTAPIMIDSTSFTAIETALKYTSGKSIVNSVNFEHGDLEVIKYIELCRDMNAALICLTIDEEGMAKKKDHKIKIIKRFVDLCDQYNYPRKHIFIDCLTFALTTGDEEYRNAGKESIETLQYIKENFVDINSIMGVSNISFGLNPKARKILNSVFLHECVKNGLTAAIIDASKIIPITEIADYELNLCLDLIYNKQALDDTLIKISELVTNSKDETVILEDLPIDEQIFQAVVKGRSSTLQDNIISVLKEKQPLEIVNNILIPAMQQVGVYFESGKLQLPFVLKSAEIMKKAVAIIETHNQSTQNMLETNNPASLLLATVQGDVHDIGKNLVQIILENNGYKVYDIGVKQTPEDIYQGIIKFNPDSLGLSALLIKSTEYMKETLIYLKLKGISIPVICGGAALNQDFVEKELQKVYDGKVIFGKDAFSGLSFMRSSC